MDCKHVRTDTPAWPFAVPGQTRVFASVRVLRQGLPILVVCHQDDGDWVFSCATTDADEHAVVTCLGCLVDADASLAQLADLPCGELAFRDSVADPWRRLPIDELDG